MSRDSLHRLMRRKSTIAFLLTLPLLTLIAVLVAYPAGYAIYLSMLDRKMTKFVGLANFAYLVGRDRFWMVVYQTCLYALTAVALSAVIGIAVAHFVHNIPTKGQRKWRGMLLVPWVIPAALSMLGWRLLFEPSFGAFNWGLEHFGMGRIFWLGEAAWARFSVILVTVWFGAPFFMVMYLASLKSVPEELYEAASGRRRHLVAAHAVRDLPDDAQRHRHHHDLLFNYHLRRLHDRVHADQRRPARGDPGVGHVSVFHRHPGRQSPDGRQRVAVHGADPGGGRDLHPARHRQTRE